MGPKSASTASPGKRGRPSTKAGTTPGTKVSVEVPIPKGAVARETSSFSLESVLHFALLAGSSLLLSTALFSLSVPITKGDLAWTSKRLDSWRDVMVLLAWRVIELAVPWFSGYDGLKMALDLLSPTDLMLTMVTSLGCVVFYRPHSPSGIFSPAQLL